MTDMRLTAQQLAAKGRFGDTRLLHVSEAELQGIASLIPGGLTVNPETGLPEAFFFLPFLASLFGAAAPAATAAAAAAPALASAAGTAAAGAGATAAAGLSSLGSSLATLPSTLAHGIGSMFGGGAAAAAPAAAAVDPIVTGATAGTAPAAGISSALPLASNPALMNAVSPLTKLPSVTQVAPVADIVKPTIYTPAAKAAATVAPVQVPGTGAYTAATALPDTVSVVPTARPETLTETGSKIGGWLSKNPMLALGGISALSNMFKGGGKKKDDDEKDDKDLPTYEGGDPSFPGSDYSPGHSSEWNYFPRYRYASGGIVSLANGGGVDLQAQQPQDQSFPLNGVPGTDEAPMLEDIPSSNYPSSQIGTEPEPSPDDTVRESSGNDKELITQAVEALQGKSADPRPILLAFMQTFGEQALQDLAQRVKGMGGGSDGQSDSVPAMIDGKQPAALSQGEFVVPADAVSHLGNGSTDAGAQHLQGMVDNVRQSRTGSPTPPPRLNGGGLVSLMQ